MSEQDPTPSIADEIRSQRDTLPLAKAVLVGGDLGRSEQIHPEEQQALFGKLGALDPPYDPEMLCILFEHSNSLRQNVDAYATNIHAFGHRFDPVIDLEGDDVHEQLAIELDMRNASSMSKRSARRARRIEKQDEVDERIDGFRESLRREICAEQIRLKHFFDYCCLEESFVELRKKTCQDLETQGNAYWEILRDMDGQISQFVYAPAFTMRLMPLDRQPVEITERVRVSLTGTRTRSIKKRFRRYVQRVEDKIVWFKELGDPRTISARTGKLYENKEHLVREEDHDHCATEILHFNIHNARGPYGVPRWIGNLLSVLGSRQSEEVNFLYFENKAVPPMAMLVSGGRISEQSVKKIEDFIETNLKGKRNWHKILILEAEPAIGTVSNESSARMKIELKPLLAAQHSDALFQKYDAQSRDKVGESFRIPRLLRGDMRDFNRSTAFAALNFAEQQVFQPERQAFDFVINRRIFPAIGARFHEFVSLAPVTRDPVAMSEMVKNLTNAGILVPAEGRELAGDIFNRLFKRIESVWTKQPAQFTLAGLNFAEDTDEAPGVPRDVPGAAEPPARHDKGLGPLGEFGRLLVGLRGAMRKAQSEADLAAFHERHAVVNSDDDVEVIRVPVDEMSRWFDDDAAE